MRRMSGRIVIAAVLCVAGLGITLAAQEESESLPAFIVSPSGQVPHAVHQGGAMSEAAYAAALSSPDVLASVPCTCGCIAMLGHRNNLDCYIDRVYPDGAIRFTTHGINCGVCQLITRDAVAGAADGMTPDQLRMMILDRYGDAGM